MLVQKYIFILRLSNLVAILQTNLKNNSQSHEGKLGPELKVSHNSTEQLKVTGRYSMTGGICIPQSTFSEVLSRNNMPGRKSKALFHLLTTNLPNKVYFIHISRFHGNTQPPACQEMSEPWIVPNPILMFFSLQTLQHCYSLLQLRCPFNCYTASFLHDDSRFVSILWKIRIT